MAQLLVRIQKMTSRLNRLYIANSVSFSSFETWVARYDIPKDDRGAFLQVLKAKCRELARSDSGLLVSPTNEAFKSCYGSAPELSLWIVSRAGYLNNSKTNKLLSHLELKIQEKVVLSHTILQACYHFTMVARLAPKWNKVLNWLIQGCDFLTEEKGQGIELTVGLTNDEITLSVTVHKLSFSLMKTEDLLITSTLLSSFKTNPHCVINESSIYNNRCFLLPNFTMGYIYSASHFLPPGKEFQTYDQVRLHWKKQHGIILPERESLFYQVFFKNNPRKFFSYPGSCVYKSKPIQYSSRDTDTVATSFITDVHTRLPTICGEQVRYANRALTPYADLQPPTTQGLSHTNLKRLPAPLSQTQASVPSRVAKQPQHKATTMEASSSQVVPCAPRLNLAHSSGPRVVPRFKSKSNAPPVHKVVAPQMKPQAPIIPRFKPTVSIGTSSQVLGKRQASTGTAKAVSDRAKRPCLESRSTIIAQRVEQTPKPTQQKLLPAKERVQAYTNSHQTVPDLMQSVSSQFDPDDSDFMPSVKVSQVNRQKTTPHEMLLKAPAKQQAPEKTTRPVFPGIGSDLLKKINKAKAGVLKKWLGDNGVKCRSKEKKDDLVRMVAQHITSTGKSFDLNT